MPRSSRRQEDRGVEDSATSHPTHVWATRVKTALEETAMTVRPVLILTVLALLAAGPTARGQEYDLVVRGGTVYDGGGPPAVGDVAVRGGPVAAAGGLGGEKGRRGSGARRKGRAPG